jgi:hypothetical protein
MCNQDPYRREGGTVNERVDVKPSLLSRIWSWLYLYFHGYCPKHKTLKHRWATPSGHMASYCETCLEEWWNRQQAKIEQAKSRLAGEERTK